MSHNPHWVDREMRTAAALCIHTEKTGTLCSKCAANAVKRFLVEDKKGYRRGIKAAASLVEMFDKHVQHPYRLSDCILGKFNLLAKRKIRKNKFELFKR